MGVQTHRRFGSFLRRGTPTRSVGFSSLQVCRRNSSSAEIQVVISTPSPSRDPQRTTLRKLRLVRAPLALLLSCYCCTNRLTHRDITLASLRPTAHCTRNESQTVVSF
ncbi:unnamed protein product [Scytosiphon promiscuus]